eukprot:jgi/Undpi1/8443/HiC_scaffold_25.g10911.m1
MNKSGGTTVKRLLRPSLDKNGIKYGLFDNAQWKKGVDYLRNDYLERGTQLTWGGYTEALRPIAMRKCKWFTVFRHPVERLVSAFFYCKNASHDALCGTPALNAADTDLLTFAKHWGNFGVRQFALAYVQPEAVLTSPLAQTEPNHPAWYLLKRYMDGPRNPLGTKVTDSAMRPLLEPIERLLSEKYTAVGILEQWDTTMELFNGVLEFPNFNWTEAFDSQGSQNINEGEAHRVEEEAMNKALTDVKIKHHLWLDLILYEHAVAVHEVQLAQYRRTKW